MQQRSRSFIVLLEILIVVLFFSLSATVVLGVFVDAHDMIRMSGALEDGNYAAQMLAEHLIGQDAPEDYLTLVGFRRDENGRWTKTDQSLEIIAEFQEESTPAGTLWDGIICAGRGAHRVELPVSWYLWEEES